MFAKLFGASALSVSFAVAALLVPAAEKSASDCPCPACDCPADCACPTTGSCDGCGSGCCRDGCTVAASAAALPACCAKGEACCEAGAACCAGTTAVASVDQSADLACCSAAGCDEAACRASGCCESGCSAGCCAGK